MFKLRDTREEYKMYLDEHNLKNLDMLVPLFHSMLPEVYEERNIPVINEKEASATAVEVCEEHKANRRRSQK
jgi:hypothetical protein